jgi:two-component system, chemotaxis family, sensor kinase CheA
MSIDLSRFHATFFAESLAGLSHVEQALLEIELRGHDQAAMDAIFRDVHSLKGSAGSLGFGVIAELAHEMESVLDRMRQGQMSASAESTNVLLRGVDCLRNWVLAAEANKPVDPAASGALVYELQLLLRHISPAGDGGAAEAAATLTTVAGKQKYVVVFRPARDFFHSGNDPARFIGELAQLGVIQCTVDLSGLPSIDAFEPTTCYLAWRITLETAASANDIREVFEWVSNACALEIEHVKDAEAAVRPVAAAGNVARAPDSGASAGAGAAAGTTDARREASLTTMHVRTDKIDDLVNLVGELVITHTMLKQSAQQLDAIKDARAVSVFAQLERNVQDIQERVLAIRMMPVNHVFGRFPRLVRDLGLQLGKAIELKLSGEQAELDKSVIEQLVDPLTHLVRNALDHGVESPADRLAAGKSAKGTLALHAEHRGGRFVITVTDDGRGIDPASVKRRAVEIGLLDATDDFDEAAMYALLLKPGFSTAQKVSSVSGRGVGLDVVSQNVRKLGGSLDISSIPGKGTTFTINLPLTLAIVDGMIVGVAGERYIIPITFIRECLQVSAVKLQSVVGQGQVLQLRGEYIPVLKLSDVCTLHGAPSAQPVLVVLEAENRVIALQVDELLGQDQVVIKSLEANYRKVEFMAGASILGDGRVALILDATEVVKQAATIKVVAAQGEHSVALA